MFQSLMDFKTDLRERLSRDLPGASSQMKMVPEARRREIKDGPDACNARKAAVLICLFPDEVGDIRLVLIRRNEYDGVHSGQISFPGGRFEKEDADMIYTALREAEEETNILIRDVEVLGEITPVYIPPSNFFVSSVVGWTKKRPNLIPDPSEVSEILDIPLSELLDPNNIQRRNISHKEFNVIDVPCFIIQGHIVWGATAMMLMEFVDLLGTGYRVPGTG